MSCGTIDNSGVGSCAGCDFGDDLVPCSAAAFCPSCGAPLCPDCAGATAHCGHCGAGLRIDPDQWGYDHVPGTACPHLVRLTPIAREYARDSSHLDYHRIDFSGYLDTYRCDCCGTDTGLGWLAQDNGFEPFLCDDCTCCESPC